MSATALIPARLRRGRPRQSCERRAQRPAGCARRSRRSGSRSGSRRSSPCSASPPPPRPGCLAEIDRLGTNLLTVTNGQSLTGPDRRAPAPCTGDDRPHRSRRAGAVHSARPRANAYRSPLIPAIQHQRADRRGGQPRPAAHGRQHRARRQLPERRHRQRAGRRARRRRRAAAGDRPHLPARADLGRRHVVLRRRDPQPRGTRARDRQRRARRVSRRRALPEPSTGTPRRSTCAPRPARSTPCTRCSPRPPTPKNPSEVDVSQPSLALTAPRRGPGRVQRPVPRARRRRAAGRRGRRREHHDHLGARAPLGDRPAPRPRRDPGPDPHPVPGRGDPARAHRRRRRSRRRRARHRWCTRPPSTGPS